MNSGSSNHRQIMARGFTLIEMLVVIAVIATLAGVATPLFLSMRAKSKETACLANLQQISIALQAYLQENQSRMPTLALSRTSKSDPSPVLETLLMPFLESDAPFHCPADAEEFAKTGSSYCWNTTQNNRTLHELFFFGEDHERPQRIPLISDKEAWHPSGANILYADLSSSNEKRFRVGR